MRDVVRTFCIFSFLFILDTLFFVHWSCAHLVIANLVLMLIYILRLLLLSFIYLYTCCFVFFLYAQVSYLMYAILYFYFTLKCLDEFCLKCFRNTGCQSLLAINSLLAKFFKSLCYDRFYCIQQVSIS